MLDPFLGGGTTAVAALRTKRKCVGVEADDAHVELCIRRVKSEVGKSEQELFQ